MNHGDDNDEIRKHDSLNDNQTNNIPENKHTHIYMHTHGPHITILPSSITSTHFLTSLLTGFHTGGWGTEGVKVQITQKRAMRHKNTHTHWSLGLRQTGRSTQVNSCLLQGTPLLFLILLSIFPVFFCPPTELYLFIINLCLFYGIYLVNKTYFIQKYIYNVCFTYNECNGEPYHCSVIVQYSDWIILIML